MMSQHRPSFDAIVNDLGAILAALKADFGARPEACIERIDNVQQQQEPVASTAQPRHLPLLLEPFSRPSFEWGSMGSQAKPPLGSHASAYLGTPAERMLGVLNQILGGQEVSVLVFSGTKEPGVHGP